MSRNLRDSKVGWIITLMFLAMVAFIIKGYKDEAAVLHFRDFKQPYASARCVLKGCDPYSEADTLKTFLAAGGDNSDAAVFAPYSALYPPPSLLMLAPIAALPYAAAHTLWFGFIAVLFCLAAAMVANLCIGSGLAVTAVLAAFVVSSTILLMLGQISGPVVALVVIGVWCLLRRGLFWPAVLSLTLALLLKPHDAWLFVFAYLFCAGAYWRRAAIAILLLAGISTVASLAVFAHSPTTSHWRSELQASLRGNSASGNVNDPVLANREASNIADLQVLFGTVTPEAKLYNLGAVGLSGLLLLLWIVPMLQLREAEPKHLLGLAAIACLTLLPIYHRQYDTRLLLLVFPATAFLLKRRGPWGGVALALTAAATLLTWHKYINFIEVKEKAPAVLTVGKTLVLFRPLPEIELLLAAFFVAAMWAELLEQRRTGLASRSIADPSVHAI